MINTVLCLVCLLSAAAVASPIALTAELTLNLISGKHDTGAGGERLNFVPLPLGDLDARYRRTTVHLEGIPGVTFGYDDGRGGKQYTRLSIVNFALRQELGGGFFAGIGQTIYNQRTDYAVSDSFVVASQASRVTGVRFEAGYAHRFSGVGRFEYSAAVNPAMHGVERSVLRSFFGFQPSDVLNGERAVQVDTSLRFVRSLRFGDLVYGLRYINYTARYDLRGRRDDGSLADRNVGILSLIGYRVRF